MSERDDVAVRSALERLRDAGGSTAEVEQRLSELHASPVRGRVAKGHGRALLAAAAVVAVVVGSVAMFVGEDSRDVVSGPSATDATGVASTAGIPDAAAKEALVGLLLHDEPVLSLFPELSPRTAHSTGESYGELRASDVAGGPLGAATGGVVRQWTSENAPDLDGSAQPAIVSVMSMALQFQSFEAAERAGSALLPSVGGNGGQNVPHATFDARIAPPDGDSLTHSAVGFAVVDDRLFTVQVDGIQPIEPGAVSALLDAASERLG